MKDIEFISYLPTPKDAHMLGIVTLRLYGRIIFRLKHMNTKDQTGTFFAASSLPVEEQNGTRYLSSFELDSKMESQMLNDFIRENVNRVLSQPRPNPMASPSAQPMKQSASVFEEQMPF